MSISNEFKAFLIFLRSFMTPRRVRSLYIEGSDNLGNLNLRLGELIQEMMTYSKQKENFSMRSYYGPYPYLIFRQLTNLNGWLWHNITVFLLDYLIGQRIPWRHCGLR